MKKAMLSVILPAYNEEQMIAEAAETIDALLNAERIEHEILFVDDGSRDNTYAEIEAVSARIACVRGISFSRNFGKESAMLAGLTAARGACAAVIDCDLQHPPEKLVEMYRLWEEGYEIVEAVKEDRGRESRAHGFFAGLFYKIISHVTGLDLANASDFRLLDRKAIDAVVKMRERGIFFRAISSWVGFKTARITFCVRERTQGESKWSVKSLIRYAVSSITSYSSFPMQITTMLGALTFFVSLILAVVSLVQKFFGMALEGFTTVIILQLFFSSIIMFALGIIGYYLSKIYNEILARPRYIISRICGKKGDEE